MTYGLEVSVRTREEWEHAIRTGIGCLRTVWLHGGGILRGDLAARGLIFAGPFRGFGRIAVRSGGRRHFGGKCSGEVSRIQVMTSAGWRPPVLVKHLEMPSSAPGPGTMNSFSSAVATAE